MRPTSRKVVIKHSIVWIDQKEARLFEVDADQVDGSIVAAPGPHIHRHANEQDLRVRNHPDDEPRFFRDVARALEGGSPSLDDNVSLAENIAEILQIYGHTTRIAASAEDAFPTGWDKSPLEPPIPRHATMSRGRSLVTVG